MDRSGVFVDAGYLFAAAAGLCVGTKSRDQVECDVQAIITSLRSFAESHSGHKMLRLYWYDGAPDGIALPRHQEIGNMAHVKLRLGRLVGPREQRRQKGVDSLIVRDLIILAQERAVCTAYLLAGDEDLREGVATAQERGLQVVLLGIPPTPPDPRNQARTLIQEADEHHILDQGFWEPHIKRIEVPAITSVSPELDPESVGAEYAQEWLTRATEEDLGKLIAQRPRIPVELDVGLIVGAEKKLGSLRGRDSDKRALRRGFWKQVVPPPAE